jgi:protein gp37
MAGRLKALGSSKYQNDGDPKTSGPGFALTLHENTLDQPSLWKKPRTIFVNSMSDLFHIDVPLEFITKVFDTIRDTPQHQYQILTKRSKQLATLASQLNWPDNLWMGVSIETANYKYRIDHLKAVPAKIKFLSCEPLIGPLGAINLNGIDWVIVGGESGRSARPMEYVWVTEIRDQCLEANTPFFFKQWGGIRAKTGGRQLDGRVWDEIPTSITA